MPKTILIVEDNEMNMKLFCDLLEAQGYETVCAVNGAEAMRLAQEQPPDLILMDIQLPDMSGIDVASVLRKTDALKTIPIVAITAFAMPGNEEKALANGCDSYITKPISVTSFIVHIQKALRGR